jgi:uncharacterized membrane protein
MEKKMRKKIIIVGIILLIIGISFFIYGTNHYNYYKQLSERGYIDIPNTNNINDDKAQMTFGTTLTYIGFFILFIGAILTAIGFFLKEN